MTMITNYIVHPTKSKLTHLKTILRVQQKKKKSLKIFFFNHDGLTLETLTLMWHVALAQKEMINGSINLGAKIENCESMKKKIIDSKMGLEAYEVYECIRFMLCGQAKHRQAKRLKGWADPALQLRLVTQRDVHKDIIHCLPGLKKKKTSGSFSQIWSTSLLLLHNSASSAVLELQTLLSGSKAEQGDTSQHISLTAAFKGKAGYFFMRGSVKNVINSHYLTCCG